MLRKITVGKIWSFTLLLSSLPVFADTMVVEEMTSSQDRGLVALAAGIVLGLAAIGGTLAQAKATSSALEGIARNPGVQGRIFTSMIIGLALIESLVIYAFIIAIFLQGKV